MVRGRRAMLESDKRPAGHIRMSSSRDRLEQALHRIADPTGEGILHIVSSLFLRKSYVVEVTGPDPDIVRAE
jgi:hypothetical protein